MKTLTIFTPAYNRAHTLPRTFASLCRQTCKDFEWLVIDDGSTDSTPALVAGWQQADHGFAIRYIRQDNQGMHGAHNTAYAHISTELNVCIDSDDYMPDDAVGRILSLWHSLSDDERYSYAGIIGLDVDCRTGQVIGRGFPPGLEATTLSGYYARGGAGDKKQVYRTDVVRRYPPYPLFPGERYVGLAVLYTMIDRDYPLRVLNAPLVVVDYQTDGSSYGMYRQYWNNPRGFAYLRTIDMQYAPTFRRRFASCVHYVSSAIRSRNARFLNESPRPLLTLCAVPLGIVLYFFIRHKVRANAQYHVK